MKTMALSFVLGCSLLNFQTNAAAQSSGYFYTGNDIYNDCKLTDPTSVRGCLNFVAGAVSGFGIGGYEVIESKPKIWPEICFPKDVTLGQVGDIFRQELRNHPEERNESAARILLHRLAQLYPCSNGGQK
jgi:hypothetical protein